MSAIVIGDSRIEGIAATVIQSVDTARFDTASDSWTVQAGDGACVTARTLIDARPSAERTIATHGIPNYFRIPGPDVARQTRFVSQCLDLLARSESTRIEAKSRIVLRRWQPRSVAARFFLTGSAPSEDVYGGPATLRHAGSDIEVHARLAGHLEAIDGAYHWRGTVSGDLPADVLKGRREVELIVDGRRANARVVEQTPWGAYTVAGSGTPPYPLD